MSRMPRKITVPEPTPAPRRPDRRTLVTRPQIVAAATELFGRRGFRESSLAAIADGAGITDAGVLHHYSTKRALVDAVVETFTDNAEALFRDLREVGGLAGLERFANWSHVYREHPDAVRLMAVLAGEAAPDESMLHSTVAKVLIDFEQVLVELMHEGVARGEIKADTDVEFEVDALLAFNLGSRQLWMFLGDRYSVPDALEQYLQRMIRRIRTPRQRRASAATTASSPR